MPQNLSLGLARSLFDGAPDAVIVIDSSGSIRSANRQTSVLFGFSHDELVGRSVESLLPERFRSRHLSLRQAYARDLRVRPMGTGLTLSGLRRDGSEFPIEINLSPIQDGDDPLVAAAIRDVSERQRVEAELSGQLQDMHRLHTMSARLIEAPDLPKMLQDVLDSTMAVQQADFGVIYLYDPATAVLKLAAQRGCSADFLRHFAVVDAREKSACGRALAESKRVIIEDVAEDSVYAPYHAIATQEGYRAVQSTLIRGRGETIKGTLATLFRQPRRFSDRELELTDIYVDLAAELIARFQNEEVLRATQASEAKSRLLAILGHDLRQPLQAAVLCVSELSELPADSEQRDLFRHIRGSLLEIREMLDTLLDASRLERGAVSVEVREFNVLEMIRAVVDAYWPQAHYKGLRLIAQGCEGSARSDPVLLKRILDNLVSNAIRYTDSGEVSIRCQHADARLRISVSDTGKGIPQDKLEKIFDEYVQLENPGRNRRRGMGLGLSIVKHIAKVLAHRIDVTSTIGQGSTFSVELPVGSSGMHPQHKPEQPTVVKA